MGWFFFPLSDFSSRHFHLHFSLTLRAAMQTRNFITFLVFSSASVQFFPPLHPINRSKAMLCFPPWLLGLAVDLRGWKPQIRDGQWALIYFTLYFIIDSLCPLTRSLEGKERRMSRGSGGTEVFSLFLPAQDRGVQLSFPPDWIKVPSGCLRPLGGRGGSGEVEAARAAEQRAN